MVAGNSLLEALEHLGDDARDFLALHISLPFLRNQTLPRLRTYLKYLLFSAANPDRTVELTPE